MVTHLHQPIGIPVERVAWLQATDPTFNRWWKTLLPCRAYANAFEIVPLNEGLQHWETHVFTTVGGVIPKPPNGELATHKRHIVTPPAKPEWLTPKIPDVDTGADGNNNQAKDKQ